MTPSPPRHLPLSTSAAMAAGALTLTLGVQGLYLFEQLTAQLLQSRENTLLIAPMIGIMESCLLLEQHPDNARHTDVTAACTGQAGSAAQLIESSLTALVPDASQLNPQFKLGYTLAVPLLQLYEKRGETWQISKQRMQQMVRTLQDNNRDAIVYFFSNHFSANSPLEQELSQDPNNLAFTAAGPIANSSYYGSTIYNWSFARTDNPLSHYRFEAARQLIQSICALPSKDQKKVVGATLLGELHHLFPNFQAGMGFSAPYLITDYSAASVTQFQQFLEQQFQSVHHLNRLLESSYASFDVVQPPSRNIRTDKLGHFTEHIDPYAHGKLPITGWLYVPNLHRSSNPTKLAIYLNGQLIGRTLVELSRQDVLAAKPEFATADTGWRFDLDFRTLPTGKHVIEVFLEQPNATLIRLGQRQVIIMDRQQSTPELQPQNSIDRRIVSADSTSLHFNIDAPLDQSDYYYNPLSSVWHDFREEQVSRYLKSFAKVFNGTCLQDTRKYSHQILPSSNPSWDYTKFASNRSLQASPRLLSGMSLYGSTTYARYFDDWRRGHGTPHYGVTEFHPLKSLSTQALRDVLLHHHRSGADFVSMFIEPRHGGQLMRKETNLFSFDPDNSQFASDQLYQSLQVALTRP